MTANLTRSRGFALIAGLMLMASMVVLSLAIATGILMEQRMAGNFSDGQLALGRAQLAQSWAEYWLYGQAVDPLGLECSPDCAGAPIHQQGTLPPSPEHEDPEWWHLNGQAAGIEPVSGLVHMDYSLPGTDDAYWLIEELHSQFLDDQNPASESEEPRLAYYRILARGTGRWPGSVAVTESVFARPWVDSLEPMLFPPPEGSEWLCESLAPGIDCGRMSWRRIR